MLLTTITAFAATFLYDTLKDKGKDFLVDKGMNKLWDFLTADKATFEMELQKIIDDTVSAYALKNPISSEDQILFYQSETLVQELLQFSFTCKMDNEKIKAVLDSDKRILPPTKEELSSFLDLFVINIKTNETLGKLFVEEHYKKEIFNIIEQVSWIRSAFESHFGDIQALVQKVDNTNLVLEWKSQLDEINENFKALKLKTALVRATNLYERMEEEALNNPALKAKAIFLQALCSQRHFNSEINTTTSKLYVQAHMLIPDNSTYQEKAVMAYLALDNKVEAMNLAEKILRRDPDNLTAWLVRCFNSDKPLMEYIRAEVPELLQKDKSFQLNIANRFLASHKFDELSILQQNGDTFLDIGENDPSSVTYKNVTYWSVWCMIALVVYYSQKKEFDSFSITKDYYDPSRLKKIRSVIIKVLDTVKNTEIDREFLVLRFQYHYINLLEHYNDADLHQLEEAYKGFEKNEIQFSVTFQFIRALATNGNETRMQQALKVIDDFPKEEAGLFLIFKIAYYNEKKDSEKVTALIKEYYSAIKVIDDLNVGNILQVFSLHKELEHDTATQELKKVADEKPATKGFLKTILKLRAIISQGETDSVQVLTDLNLLKDNMADSAAYLRDILARMYKDAGYPADAINYLSTYIDTTIINETLLLYCELLYQTQGKRAEFQTIMQAFRSKNVLLPQRLIYYDLNLAKLQNAHETVKGICLYGLKYYPNFGELIINLFAALGMQNDKEELLANIGLIDRINFVGNNQAAIYIIEILLECGFVQRAVDLMYALASDESNSELRQYYVTKTLTTPGFCLPVSDSISVGDSVTYSIDDVEHKIEITTGNEKTLVAQQILGKNIGNEITPTISPLKIHTIKIIQIESKYQVLLRKIMDDSKNPLSGMDIHQFSIEETDECSGFEKMSQQLAKLYGGQTELRRDHIKTTIEKYYRNEISFSVLSKSTFRGNSIEAYCFLISSEAELFRIPPASLNREEIKSDTTGIVIDIPTVMLLFQLDIEHELYTDKRYILPDTSFMILQTAYKEAEGKQNNYANMQITSKGISAGIVYDENYHQERMKFYDSIMNWVEKNCDVVSIPERIDELPELERDIVYDPYLLSILDNSLITKRENYILVASDTAYLNFPVFRTEKLYSIEALFKAFGTQADIEIIIEILLKKNIVGLTLSKEHLQKEFLNRASGGNNAYHTCMYNLEIGWNSATNITSAVEHVRWIAISSILAPHEKVRYIEEVFRAILPGVYPQKDVGQLLIDQIMEQFKFLPEFLGMINYCLHNVVQSFNQTKS